MKTLSLKEVIAVDYELIRKVTIEEVLTHADTSSFTNRNASFIEIRSLIIASFFNQDTVEND